MKKEFPGGVWPVMLTPFTEEGEVDYHGISALADWYIENGADGLFAVCQSSEMFRLTLEERVKVSKCVVESVGGRVPVIASGHISDGRKEQAEEVSAIADTGVEAVILITNRFAKEDEGDEIWIRNCEWLLAQIDHEIPLGFYECPYPYKRVLSTENIQWCADTGRFYFLKDTCCDEAQIEEKLLAIKGTKLKLYNANTTTLLSSLRKGAAGYSGVMANFHPRMYKWLCENKDTKEAEQVSELLSICSLIERQFYPANAKWGLAEIEKLPLTSVCRVCDCQELTKTFRQEVRMMDRLIKKKEAELSIDA